MTINSRWDEAPSGELRGERLLLHPVAWESIRAIVAGRRLREWAADYPDAGDVVVARMHHKQGRSSTDPVRQMWGHRQIVERDSLVVVGGVGFFGPPEDGVVEIGYGVVPSRRGRGYATEAVRMMVDFAWSHPSVQVVIARTDEDNVGSQRVLEKAGFSRTHGQQILRYERTRVAR